MQQVGVDIIEIARIRRALERWGSGFLTRVYTEPEIERYSDNLSSLAARFSGKEAVIKALNSKGIGLKDIEILSVHGGKPMVKLYGRAQSRARDIGLSNLAISLSHCRQYAVACAVGEMK